MNDLYPKLEISKEEFNELRSYFNDLNDALVEKEKYENETGLSMFINTRFDQHCEETLNEFLGKLLSQN